MERVDFSQGWLFSQEGDLEILPVDIPHDAMIHEARDMASPGGSANAYFPGGRYVYEKTFHAPDEWQQKTIIFEFEGIYRNSQILINGQIAGGRPYGYLGFYVRASELLKLGQTNTIRVEVDNSQLPNSRWYSGSGIFRPAHLLIGGQDYIDPDGIQVTTVSVDPAVIRVESRVSKGSVMVEILDGDERVAAGEGRSVELKIDQARLWSDETPYLYTCRVQLFNEDKIIDHASVHFGIRQITWSSHGLFINGHRTMLRGGCVHHDNGILGACAYDEAEERRIRIIKQAGFNAIRISHNPASSAMLRACDRMGLYVIDETWDMWYIHKTKFDYASEFAACYQQDIELLVRRDYNHPSVIMYSIGNELTEPYQEKGQQLTRDIVAQFHALDTSRPVSAGINLMIISLASRGKGIYDEEKGGRKDQDKPQRTGSLFFNMITSMVGTSMNKAANSDQADRVTSPCLDALDIAGYNYASGRYPLEGAKHPDRVLYGSETFPQDIAANWAMVEKYPYLIGDFMWTAWDYLGEAGIGGWSYRKEDAQFEKPYPWLLANTGAIDILGYPGAQAHYAAIVWRHEQRPYIGVRPLNHPGEKLYKSTWRWTNAIDSWSWQNCTGNPAEIEIYSAAYQVELLLNGRSLGKKKPKACKTMYKTRYTPGIIRVVAYDRYGQVVGESELQSATGQIKPRLKPEKMIACPGEVVFIPIEIADDHGIVESNADQKLTLTVEGGKLLGFGSANPCSIERFDSGTYTTYFGRAMAAVKVGMSGCLTMNLVDSQHQSRSVTIKIEAEP